MIWSPLTTNWAVNLADCDPRRSPVDTIQHHHTATNNKLNALALFAPGGRTVTPNYFIAGKEVWGIVPENYRAYTSGSYSDDHRAITYEILNSTNSPNWQFAADTLATVIMLDAEISSRYGIPLRHSSPGFIEHRNIYEWWGRSYPTACAGPSFDIASIIDATRSALTSNPTSEEEEEEMSTYFRAVSNSSPTKEGDPGSSRIWAGDNRVIGGARYSGTWERGSDGSIRRLFQGEWDAMQAAYAASGRKVPIADVHGNTIEQIYLVPRSEPKR